MNVSPLVWGITIAIMVAVFTIDLVIIGRRPHEPSMKEAGIAVSIFVGLAVIFGLVVWRVWGGQFAAEFYTGWLLEYSLSIDNLFIFLLIMGKLAVPRHLQQFALMIGIILALIFRGIFIALGAVIIEKFVYVFFLFGAYLIYTAIKMAIDYSKHANDDEEDAGDNWVTRQVKKVFPATDDYVGTKLTVLENGRRFITPMMFVIIALGTTDLIFALDSIPAIFAITREPYLVFTANVFALMGLRQLYFLLGGMLKKLVYLSLGLSVILGFIGVKLLLLALAETPVPQALGIDSKYFHIPTWVSLTFLAVVLAVTTIASLLKSRAVTQSDQTK